MISANTLFHFTKSLDNIENILKNNFSPRYCLERMNFLSDQPLDIGIPMVCFCDIPLSQIVNHVKTYGEYAIGLKKDWAIRNSISPVIYLNLNSQTNILIKRIFSDTGQLDIIDRMVNGYISEDSMNLHELFFYCKDYKGEMWRKKSLKTNVTFYDEREWRYVPKPIEINQLIHKFIINKKEYNSSKKEDLNDQLSAIKIPFTPNDIKYIIIKEENERLRMVQLIEYIKGTLYSGDQLKELSSKIISTEQIKEDI